VDSAGFLLPLLNELHGVRALAPDLPGRGLSDPIDLPRHRYRETAVAWLDDLLDTLELDTVAVVLMATPGVGELLSRLVPPNPKSVLRFAGFMGEKATLATHPELVDLMVATGRDPIAAAHGLRCAHWFRRSPCCRLLASGVIHGYDATS
jgi:pimeloyl-ACP methyl ester carboxylesterase